MWVEVETLQELPEGCGSGCTRKKRGWEEEEVGRLLLETFVDATQACWVEGARGERGFEQFFFPLSHSGHERK